MSNSALSVFGFSYLVEMMEYSKNINWAEFKALFIKEKFIAIIDDLLQGIFYYSLLQLIYFNPHSYFYLCRSAIEE